MIIQQISGSISIYHEEPIKMSPFCRIHTFLISQMPVLPDLSLQLSSLQQLHLFSSTLRFHWSVKNRNRGVERRSATAQKCLFGPQVVAQTPENLSVKFWTNVSDHSNNPIFHQNQAKEDVTASYKAHGLCFSILLLLPKLGVGDRGGVGGREHNWGRDDEIAASE